MDSETFLQNKKEKYSNSKNFVFRTLSQISSSKTANRLSGISAQDNAPVHNSILGTDYLTKMSIKTVPQPPYSRDLAPCDFWFIP